MKKIISICSVFVIMMLTSFLLIGCGDKYKNMYLEVQYMQCDSNGEKEWKTVDVSNGLDFVLSDDYKVNSSDNFYTLKCRVLVKNSKASVDQIYVFSTGSSSMSLNTKVVRDKEDFIIKVYTTGSADLSFVPNVKSSTASVSFHVNMYAELNSISVNGNYTPAVVRGGELKLNELKDLIKYEAVKAGWETNQYGVNYSIVGEGENDGVYTLKDDENNEFVLNTKDGVNKIMVSPLFKGDLVKLKATSVYSGLTSKNEEISCEFNVYVVDNIDATNINLKYDFDSLTNIKNLELYPEMNDYKSCDLVLYVKDGDKFINFDKNNENYFDVKVYVDDQEMSNDSVEAINDVKVTDITSTASNEGESYIANETFKKYRITSSNFTKTNSNKIRFVVGYKNLKFTGKDYSIDNSILSYELNLTRESLPKGLKINGQNYFNGDTISDEIFTEYRNSNRGYAIDFSAIRSIEKSTEINCTITDGNNASVDLDVYNFSGNKLETLDFTAIHNKIYIRFGASAVYPEMLKVEFKVLASPEMFKGEEISESERVYLTVTLYLNVVGSLSGVESVDGNNENLFEDITETQLLEKDYILESSLTLTTSGSVGVNGNSVEITSQNGNILFKNGNNNWVNSIRYSELVGGKYYFKATTACTDKICVRATNGFEVYSKNLKFVVSAKGKKVELKVNNDPFMKVLKSDNNYITEAEGSTSYKGQYIAAQNLKIYDFYSSYDENGNLAIVSIKPEKPSLSELGKSLNGYSVSCLELRVLNHNTFTVQTKGVNATGIIKVSTKYYAGTGYAIEEKTHVEYLEIAVYNPASNLAITADNEEISYINSKIISNAETTISLQVNSNATRNIYFSDTVLNDEINDEFAYKVQVTNDLANNDGFLQVSGVNDGYLDASNMQYSLRLLKKPPYTNIPIQFTLKQFDFNNDVTFSRTFTKTIKVVDTVYVDKILVSNTFNSNVYLSLQSEGQKTTEFSARVSNPNASYKVLGYELYDFNKLGLNYCGNVVLDNTKIRVEINSENETVRLTCLNLSGGKYVLKLFAIDSYNEEEDRYEKCEYITIHVSDGELDNPFYLRNLDDIKNIKNGLDKHYIMANDINISMLNESFVGEFTGSINGFMGYYDATNGKEYNTQFKLVGLNIGNSFKVTEDETRNYYALFENNNGILKNLIFDKVSISLSLAGSNFGNTSNEFNVAVITAKNNGTIQNCSVNFVSNSTITIVDPMFKNINIGAFAGENNGKIYFYDNLDRTELKQFSNYPAMITNSESLAVVVNSLETTTSGKFNVNFGGVAGVNNKDISANYFDFDKKMVSDYLTINNDISLTFASGIDVSKYTANIGGVVGQNNVTTGNISQICITGEIIATGENIEIGGIAGTNSGNITNCATYSLKISGESSNQNVGGVVGKLETGNLENIYVLFIQLSDLAKVAIEGCGKVGGIAGTMTAGTITNCNVQSFYKDDSHYELQGNTVAGLVAEVSVGTISLSYVKANLSGKTVTSLAPSNFGNSFFIGRLEATGETTVNESSSEDSYSLVFFAKIFESEQNSVEYVKLMFNDTSTDGYMCQTEDSYEWYSNYENNNGTINCTGPIDPITLFSNLNEDSWSTDANYISANYGLPVIKCGGETLLAVVDSMIVTVDASGFEELENAGVSEDPGETEDPAESEDIGESENGEYVVYKDGIFIVNGDLTTAIIFLSDKTYNLVADYDNEGNLTTSGLLKKEISPVIASGAYYINTIEGADIFYLSNNRIRFVKTGRVELEFVSLFDPNVSDRVVFFVEYGITNAVFDKDIINMSTNSTQIIEMSAKFNEDKSLIDESKILLGITGGSNDLTVTSMYNVSEDVYVLGDISIKSNGNTGNASSKTHTLTLTTKLDLSKYVFDKTNNQTIAQAFSLDEVVFDKTSELNCTVYQAATDVKFNINNLVISTGDSLNFDVEVETSYIEVGDTTNKIIKLEENNFINNILELPLEDKESIRLTISSDTQAVNDLQLNSLWKMFKYDVSYKLNSEKTGYIYSFRNFRLDEKYQAIMDDYIFRINVQPISNTDISDELEITLEPQRLNSLRMENFKSGVATLTSDSTSTSYVVEYSSSDTQSAIIVPGKSGLIKIYAEPSFARIDSIIISSSTIEVDGKTYAVQFQQMVYDTVKGCYVSYPGNTTENTSLRLQKGSYINSDKQIEYTGVLYVRTVLEYLVGVKDTFEITATAVEYQRINGEISDNVKNSYVAKKTLVTQYNPGVSLYCENAVETTKDDKIVYIIEKNSTVSIYAKVWGYQFNSQPTITITSNETNIISYRENGVEKLQDGSHLVKYDLTIGDITNSFDFKIKLSLTFDGIQTDSEEKTLTFYPVDFIPNRVYMAGVNEGFMNIGIGNEQKLEMFWTSNNQNTQRFTDLIYDYDKTNGGNTQLNFFYRTLSNGQNLYDEYLSVNDNFVPNVLGIDKVDESTSGYYKFIANGEYATTINFYLKYNFKYEDGKYTLRIYPKNSTESGNVLSYSFKLNLTVMTTEATPDLIYTKEQFNEMSDGGNYILMNDIDLGEVTPIETNIASLDGNGYLIKISNFLVPTATSGSSSSEIVCGLFKNVSGDTILKNITIDLSNYTGTSQNAGGSDYYDVMMQDDNAVNSTSYFGFLAGKNNGLIYNCDVIVAGSNAKKIRVLTSSNISYMAGLVGYNAGSITNSRVGTEKRTEYKNNKETVYDNKILTLSGPGCLSGLVSYNIGKISSCYVYNTNIINTRAGNANINVNMTAGLVCVNDTNATISGSFVKGNGISAENVRGTVTSVENTGSGSAAGFVFINSGTIMNCYSNIYVKSSSSAVAGFVYRNNQNAVIKQSYSASKVSSDASDLPGADAQHTLATELPFVGVGIDGEEANILLSYGELNNCYYLKLTTDNFDEARSTADMDIAKEMDLENFSISENLTNYAFVQGTEAQQRQGIWSYYTVSNNTSKTMLPELTSANQIAVSRRYLQPEGEKFKLIYVDRYKLGSEKNPYIIRNAEEYNTIFNNKNNIFTGYIRLINDINFAKSQNETTTINTAQGYSLGGEYQNVTVFDGNEMTISNVDIRNNDNQETNMKNLGLFSEISNAVVKNFNVEYVAMPYTSTSAKYSGGIAGTINNSYVIGLNLRGTSSGQNFTTISAQNFGGGLAGIIKGNSGIFNVTSNLNVVVAYKESNFYKQYIDYANFKDHCNTLTGHYISGSTPENELKEKYEEYMSKLSYGGGLAGVIDINNSGVEKAKHDFSNNVNINGIVIGDGNTTKITSDIAGFVVGHLSRNSFANNMKAVINIGGYQTVSGETDAEYTGSYVQGDFIAGGLVGENYGRISKSQVSSNEKTQQEYTDNIIDYMFDYKDSQEIESMYNANSIYGNPRFVRGQNGTINKNSVAGGFVGVNYGGYITDSYSRASLSTNAKYLGGFTGLNVNGLYSAVYNANFIDLKYLNNTEIRYIGGMIGYDTDRDATEFNNSIYSRIGYNSIEPTSTDNSQLLMSDVVSVSFFDYSQLQTINENITSTNNHINYLMNRTDNAETYPIKDLSGIGTPLTLSYIDYFDIIPSGNLFNKISQNEIAQNIKMENLFDINLNSQNDTYTSIYLGFDVDVWEKDNKLFFPLIKEDPATNYYEISEVQDLRKITLHPEGNFILSNDIILTAEYENYVLDVNFRGTLIGKMQIEANGTTRAPKISGIKIKTNNKTRFAGFFRELTNAKINNIDFVYDKLTLPETTDGYEKEAVGLLAAKDSYGDYNSIVISTNGLTEQTINGFKTNIIIDEGVSVIKFGGLIGDCTVSKFLNCEVKANININAGANANIGGLLGQATGKRESGSVNLTSCKFEGDIKVNKAQGNVNVGGAIGNSSSAYVKDVDVKLGKIDIKASSNVYLGGIIGQQSESNIVNSKATFVGEDKEINVTTGETGNHCAIGGVSAYISNNTNIENSNMEDELNKDVVNTEVDFGCVNITVNNVTSNETDNSATVHFGGLIGESAGYVSVAGNFVQLSGKVEVPNAFVGGIIGYSNDSIIEISECGVYAECLNGQDVEGYTINAKSISAGGFIGAINEGSGATGESVIYITRSYTSGAFWAEHTDSNGMVDSNEELSLGGFIGSWTGNNIDLAREKEWNLTNNKTYSITSGIKDCYTTLGLDYSGFILSSGSNLNVDALIGKLGTIDEGKKLSIERVVYSSDYTRALDEKSIGDSTIYTSVPDNFTAYSLVEKDLKGKVFSSTNETPNESTNDSPNWGTDKPWGLPYINRLWENFDSVKSLYNTDKFGTSLRPQPLSGQSIQNSDNYKYFMITPTGNSTGSESVISIKFSGDFKGVILGNGLSVDYSGDNNTIGTLTRHSALSNIKFDKQIENNADQVALIGTNQGTLFDTYFDYYFNGIPATALGIGGKQDAGIAITNQGNLIYCYNVGTIDNAGCMLKFGGMSYTNIGNIVSSAFVGTITTGLPEGLEIGGICVWNEDEDNKGFIYNTYSAGVISLRSEDQNSVRTFIYNADTTNPNYGTIENCFYDVYSNTEFAEIKKENASLLVPVETEDFFKNTVELNGDWESYPMSEGPLEDETSGENGNVSLELKESYNYGYPIFVNKQKRVVKTTSSSGEETYIIEDIEDKGLYTGKGIRNKTTSFTDEDSDGDPYLIFNIGAMAYIKNIESLIDEAGFKLINDLDFEKNGEYDASVDQELINLITDWSGCHDSFKGEFYSGERREEANSVKEVKTIAHLNGYLFTMMQTGAYIHDLILENATGNEAVVTPLVQDGASASAEQGAEPQPEQEINYSDIIKIEHVKVELDDSFDGNSVYVGTIESGIVIINPEVGKVNINKSGIVGGIVESITGGHVAINGGVGAGSRISAPNKGSSTAPEAGNATTAGGIVGLISGGEVSVSGGFDGFVGASGSVGGIIGSISGGNVSINECTVATNTDIYGYGSSANAGGVVGSISGGTVNFVDNLTFEGNIGNIDAFVPRNAGGIVGCVTNGTVNVAENIEIVSNPSFLRATYAAGGVFGSTNQECTLKAKSIKVRFETMANNQNYYARIFGGLVGECNGGEFGLGGTGDGIEISGTAKVYEAKIMGGAIGYVKSGEGSAEDTAAVTLNNIKIDGLEMNSKHEENPAINMHTVDELGVGGLIGICMLDLELGKITLENFEVGVDGITENVGGLIGHWKGNKISTIENMTDLVMSNLTVRGMVNVGGLIGHYENDTNIEIDEEFIEFFGVAEGSAGDGENEGYAKVCLPVDLGKHPENNEAKNFGGIFGFYDSTSTMSFTVPSNSAGEDPYYGEFVNYNEVLCINTDDNPEIVKAYSAFDHFWNSELGGIEHIINYVGGIAGSTISTSIAGINNGNIGTATEESYFDNSMQSFVGKNAHDSCVLSEQVLNMQNVGGIVGAYVGGANLVQVTNAYSTNKATIGGFKNVGGVIGSIINVETYFNMPETQTSVTNSKIKGYENVGGICGLVEGVINSSLDAPIQYEGKNNENYLDIEGFTCVGGIIGRFVGATTGGSESSFDSKMYVRLTKAKISAPINVGGIVGYAEYGTYNANDLINIEVVKPVEQDMIEVNIDGNTNVGGMVGYADASDDEKLTFTNIDGDTQLEVDIVAKEYYWGNITVDSRNEQVFFMPTSIGGVVGYANNVTMMDISLSGEIRDNGENITKNISKLKNYVLKANLDKSYPEPKFESNIKENCYKSIETIESGIGGIAGTIDGSIETFGNINPINVCVANGMNIGGYVGYAKLNNDSNTHIASIGEWGTDNKLYVAGGLGVGGIFGKIKSDEGELSFGDVELENVVLQQTSEEEPVFGEYVGGFVGVLDCIALTNTNLSANNVIIDTSMGSYYGGFVGYVQNGNIGTIEEENVSDFNGVQVEYTTTPEGGISTSINLKNNKMAVVAGLVDANTSSVIIGKRSDNQEGQEVDDFTIWALRVSGNVNNQQFNYDEELNNITLLTCLEITSGINIARQISNNDYSMFKSLIVVKYDENGNTTNLTPIYDYDNVKKVVMGGDNKIAYTIYEQVLGEPILYSRLGIATLYTKKDGDLIDKKGLASSKKEEYGLDGNENITWDVKLYGSFHLSPPNKVSVGAYFEYFTSEKVYLNKLRAGETVAGSSTIYSYMLQEDGIGTFQFTTIFAECFDDHVDWNDDIWNGDRTYSLFDIAGEMSNRTAGENNETIAVGEKSWAEKITNFFKKIFMSIKNLFSKNKTIALQTYSVNRSSALDYITNIYEGEYGFIADIYSSSWTFEYKKGTWYNKTDTISHFINREAVYDWKNDLVNGQYVTYAYYSIDQPEDYKNRELIELDTTTQEQSINTGSYAYKYLYENGLYYIALADESCTKEDVLIQPKSKLDSVNDPWILKTNGCYFVLEDYNSIDNTQKNGIFGQDHEFDLSTNYLTKYLTYKGITTIPTGIENVDYKKLDPTLPNSNPFKLKYLKIVYNNDAYFNSYQDYWGFGTYSYDMFANGYAYLYPCEIDGEICNPNPNECVSYVDAIVAINQIAQQNSEETYTEYVTFEDAYQYCTYLREKEDWYVIYNSARISSEDLTGVIQKKYYMISDGAYLLKDVYRWMYTWESYPGEIGATDELSTYTIEGKTLTMEPISDTTAQNIWLYKVVNNYTVFSGNPGEYKRLSDIDSDLDLNKYSIINDRNMLFVAGKEVGYYNAQYYYAKIGDRFYQIVGSGASLIESNTETIDIEGVPFSAKRYYETVIKAPEGADTTKNKYMISFNNPNITLYLNNMVDPNSSWDWSYNLDGSQNSLAGIAYLSGLKLTPDQLEQDYKNGISIKFTECQMVQFNKKIKGVNLP